MPQEQPGSPLELSHEDFSWRVWSSPGEVLKRLPKESEVPFTQRGTVHALKAAAWTGLLCLEEAEYEAKAALAAGVFQDPWAHASTFGTLAIVADSRHDTSAIELRKSQLSIIWRHALVRTDLYVAALLNEFNTSLRQEVPSDGEVARVEQAWRGVPYTNLKLKASRKLLLEFYRSSFTLSRDREAGLTLLVQTIRDADTAEEKAISALGHMSLSRVYQKSDLYSASLAHAAIANHIWEALGRPERQAEVILTQSKVLKSLGLIGQAEELLNKIKGAGFGSRAMYIASECLSQLAEIREYEGKFDECVRLTIASAHSAPSIVMGDSTEPIASWLAAGIRASEAGDFQAVEEVKEMIASAAESLTEDEPWKDFVVHIVPAILDRDFDQLYSLEQNYRARWADFKGFGYELNESGVDGLFDSMWGMLRGATGDKFNDDLVEYWQHICHISGEDNEEVRARYRAANCLPVLNRILSTGDSRVSAELQLELIELVRFGALSGLSTLITEGSDVRQPLRRIAREHLESAGFHFPAIYGEARPLMFGSKATELASIAEKPPVDVNLLLRRDRHGDLPDLLQLYLRGNSLHWAYREAGEKPESGTRQISRRTLSIINSFRAWMTPHIGDFEGHVAAQAGLETSQLAAVAAARTAFAPFIDMRQLAIDFLYYLPSRKRNIIWNAIESLDLPTMTQVSLALGEFIPDCALSKKTSRRLLLSTDLELATFPFSLARKEDWEKPLLGYRYPSILPPLNILTASAPSPSTDGSAPWIVAQVGNSLGDLFFAGKESDSESVLSTIVITDATKASRTAVVYRGHLAEPPFGQPSESGIYVGRGQILRSRAMLEDARPWRTPARLALLACRAAGWDLGGEWGGIAAAAMLRGTDDVIAPLWPLIDAQYAELLDKHLGRVIGQITPLHESLQEEMISFHDSWISGEDNAIPPHWWASLALMSR